MLIPLLFMGDVVGRLFREFAITLAVSILISAVVSLTLTPMMCAKLLHHTPPEKQGRFYRWSGDMFERLIGHYGRMLNWVLDRQPATLVVAALTLVLTVVLYIVIPKGFFPIQDTGAIQGISEAPQSISFAAMAERQQALARVVLQDPAVASLTSFIGVDGTNATLNSGRMLINLKPRAERRASATIVIRRLQRKLADVEGISLYMQPVQDLTIEARVSRTQYQFTVEDTDPTSSPTWVHKLVERLKQEPQLADVASDLSDNGLQAYVEFDRATASRLGITPAAIDNALYNAFGQRLVSTIFTQSNQYRVVLEVKPEFQRGPAALSDLYVTSTVAGQPPQQVPLSSIARIIERPASLAINHIGQFPASTVSFNLASGASLGDAVAAIEKVKAELGMPAERADQFPGRRARVPRVARERAVADPRGDRHHVHRARRALRELHPPDHDPVDAAVGGCRRAARADRLRQRSVDHRDHRHHPADRHREEERDHDDRLRARRRARAGDGAARRDLPGLPVAVPAHHDDDDGRDPGRAAADDRLGRRFRAAASARHRDGRRPVAVAGAHALHDASHLPRLRQPRPACEEPAAARSRPHRAVERSET